MQRTIAQKIHYSNLQVGTVYRCRIPALGEFMGRLTDKGRLEFEITEGRLQSQTNKNKKWNKGDTFEAIPGCADFWEMR